MMKKGKNNMKTSMSWDGWQEKEEQEQEDDDGDDDDDDDELEDERFFEPMDRISSVVPINLENDEEFDDFDDSRMSFASAMPAPHRFSSATISDDAMNSDLEMSHYDVWMAEPGSISERRMRLLEGMGLCGNNTEFVKLASNIEVCSKDTVDDSNSLLKAAAEKPKSTAPLTMDNNKNKTLSSPLIVITRSKSDAAEGNSKRHRCQELLGSSSPPPLARRTPSAPSSLCHCHGESLVRGSTTHMSGRFRPSPSNNSTFFCKIKNLDTGKEFIVNEDGTWNCLSDLETGQQLTMEEFERCVGYSPIVKELMRRENVKTDRSIGKGNPRPNNPPLKSFKSPTTKKRGGWLKNIKGVANSVSGLITADSNSSSPASSSMERSNRNSEWMKVRHHGKPYKEVTGLYMCQEIHAHQGSIWSIRFSPDAGYLASAGEDRTIHVWQVIEGEPPLLSALEEPNFTPARTIATANASLERPPLADGGYPSERKRRGKVSYSTRKSTIPDYVVLPDTIFSLSDKPICSFRGHQDDVLDISWSNSSELLLSSSMDKTVRLWDMKSKSCLKLFAHNDYVTCIQFNPVDERYFISGSLDAKVRIWSIPDRQVVDWNDLHEMVTAACYTPDGQGALVGSHTGSCRLYSTSDCKLRQKGQIEIQNKKKKSHAKKITGFQFAPGSSSEVLITSADSQIRIFDGVDLIHKFRGFRNTSSQIAASFTGDGKYVVCASEDSQVYIWKREEPRSIGSNSGGGGGKSKGNHVTTRSHEHFQCRDVSLAIPWPGSSKNELPPMLSRSKRYNHQHLGRRPGSQHATLENAFMSNRNHCPPHPRKASFSEGISNIPEDSDQMLASPSRSDSSIASSTSFSSTFRSANNSSSSLSAHAPSPSLSWRWSDANGSSSSSIQVPAAWGLAIVTAGLGGEIRVYQNFGLPI